MIFLIGGALVFSVWSIFILTKAIEQLQRDCASDRAEILRISRAIHRAGIYTSVP